MAGRSTRGWASVSRHFTGLSCFACGKTHDPRRRPGVCETCGLPLRVDYALPHRGVSLRDIADRSPTLWRYREVLPIAEADAVSLAEGYTPLLEVASRVWVKDEARSRPMARAPACP